MKTRKLGRVVHSEGKVKLVMNEPGCLTDFMEQLEDNQRVWVTIEKYYRKRSTEQNSVLHWYINEISQETGLDNETVKDVLKKKFLTVTLLDNNGEVIADNNGEVLERVKSTTELNTVEFNEFTENIRLWANDYLNLQLPLPNEDVELKFK